MRERNRLLTILPNREFNMKPLEVALDNEGLEDSLVDTAGGDFYLLGYRGLVGGFVDVRVGVPTPAKMAELIANGCDKSGRLLYVERASLEGIDLLPALISS